MVKSVVGKLIRPDVVVVMAHHNRDRMRAAAVRLLQALLSTDPFSIWPADPTPFQLQSTILLLGLLPNAALDPALFHQLATLIRVLISSNSILKFLLDFGLVESLIKSVIGNLHTQIIFKFVLLILIYLFQH